LTCLVGAEHVRSFLWPLPISLHQLRRANHDFTGLSERHCSTPVVRIEDTNLYIGEGKTNGPDLLFSAHWIGHDGHLRLGERVAFDNHSPGQLLELPLCVAHESRGS